MHRPQHTDESVACHFLYVPVDSLVFLGWTQALQSLLARTHCWWRDPSCSGEKAAEVCSNLPDQGSWVRSWSASWQEGDAVWCLNPPPAAIRQLLDYCASFCTQWTQYWRLMNHSISWPQPAVRIHIEQNGWSTLSRRASASVNGTLSRSLTRALSG